MSGFPCTSMRSARRPGAMRPRSVSPNILTGTEVTEARASSGVRPAWMVLIQKNGDCEVEASLTEHEVASSNASGLKYCNIEWKQQPDMGRK